MLSGGLGRGARLPSTRRLAVSLGVSRTTVTAAVDILAAEGFLEARRGSGTYVAALLPADRLARARQHDDLVRATGDAAGGADIVCDGVAQRRPAARVGQMQQRRAAGSRAAT